MKRGAQRLFFRSRPVRLSASSVTTLRDGPMDPSLAQSKNESGLTLDAHQKLQKINIGSWYQTPYWHETGEARPSLRRLPIRERPNLP